MISQNVLRSRFEELINSFDFEKVHKVMEFMNWCWATNDGYKVPSIDELIKACYVLFDNIKYEENESVSSGGFQVTVRPEGLLSLEFIIESKHWFANSYRKDF